MLIKSLQPNQSWSGASVFIFVKRDLKLSLSLCADAADAVVRSSRDQQQRGVADAARWRLGRRWLHPYALSTAAEARPAAHGRV